MSNKQMKGESIYIFTNRLAIAFIVIILGVDKIPYIENYFVRIVFAFCIMMVTIFIVLGGLECKA